MWQAVTNRGAHVFLIRRYSTNGKAVPNEFDAPDSLNLILTILSTEAGWPSEDRHIRDNDDRAHEHKQSYVDEGAAAQAQKLCLCEELIIVMRVS